MLPQTEIDTVKALLEVGKKLLPLFTAKKIDEAIAGIEEAKAVIADKNDVLGKATLAAKQLAEAEEKLSLSVKMKAEVDAVSDSLAAADVAAKKREAAITEVESKTLALFKENEKKAAALAATEAKLAEKEKALDAAIAEAKAELEVATALKNEFNAKLSLVKAL